HLIGRQGARGRRHLDLLAGHMRRIGREAQLHLGIMRDGPRGAGKDILELIERRTVSHGASWAEAAPPRCQPLQPIASADCRASTFPGKTVSPRNSMQNIRISWLNGFEKARRLPI